MIFSFALLLALVGSFKTNKPSNDGTSNALGFSFVDAVDHDVDGTAEGNSDGRTFAGASLPWLLVFG